MKRLVTICATVSLSFSALAPAQDIPPEYQQVLTTLAKQGDYKANVLKVNIPRNDLNVTVAKVKMLMIRQPRISPSRRPWWSLIHPRMSAPTG